MYKKTLAMVLVAFVLMLISSCASIKKPIDSENSGKNNPPTTTGDQINTVGLCEDINDMKTRIEDKVKELGLTMEDLKNGIAPTGGHERVAAVIKKAIAGEPVTLGVIGGSITEGSSTTSYDKCYASRFKEWWEELFPTSEVTLVNAGKGATGSIIGVHGIQETLLDKNPDLVVMEYAVNDGAGERDQKSYESLLRRILNHNSNPAVILLFTMREDGTNAQRVQSKIGMHYNTPMISYRNAIYPLIEGGKITWKDISPDNIHPNDKGHDMIGLLLAHYFVSVCEDLDKISAKIPPIPEPLVGNEYEQGRLYTNINLEADKLGGFRKVDDAFYQFPNGWKITGSGEAIEFTLSDCREIYLMTLRLDDEKAGIAEIKVIGKTTETKEITQNFKGLGYKYADPIFIYRNETPSEVKVIIRLKPQTQFDYFTLLGFLIS